MSLSDDVQILEQALEHAADRQSKARLALDLADCLQDSQPKVSYQWVVKAFNWIENDPLLLAESGRGLMLEGNILLRQGHFDLGQKKLEQALEIARQLDDPDLLSHVLCGLGGAYVGQDQYALAMETLIEAEAFSPIIADKNLEGKILVNLGILFYYMNDFEEAARHFNLGAEIFSQTRNTTRLSMALINLMHTAFAAADFSQALDYLSQVRALNQTAPYVEMHWYLANGAYEASQGNYQQALENYERGLEIARDEELQNGKVEILFEKTRSLLALKQPQAALKCVEETFSLLDGTQNKLDLRVSHELFSLVYEQLEQYQQALWHHRKYHQLDAEINSEMIANRLRSNEAIYRAETARKESEIVKSKNQQLENEIAERRKAEDALRESEKLYRRQAQLDHLTGVTNRRFFYELALAKVENARNHQMPLSAILIDLDHFKAINDSFGHLVGDQVLKNVAARLSEAVRDVDIVCRYGGEEFIILLPGATSEQTSPIANRVFRSISDNPFLIAGHLIKVNISLGMASWQTGDSLDDLIEHADQAMYSAKRAGRNRIMEWIQGEFQIVNP